MNKKIFLLLIIISPLIPIVLSHHIEEHELEKSQNTLLSKYTSLGGQYITYAEIVILILLIIGIILLRKKSESSKHHKS